MTIQEIIDYVCYTPENTNPVILRQMLKQFGDEMKKESVIFQEKIATPTEETQQITPDEGYDGLSIVQVEAIDGNYVGSEVPRRSGSDLTFYDGFVAYKTGYYPDIGGATIPTINVEPKATKGEVTNHWIRVKPSLTIKNGGYIPAGTLEGESVTVTAAELVSGSQTITENGTYDVTNLSEIVVEIN